MSAAAHDQRPEPDQGETLECRLLASGVAAPDRSPAAIRRQQNADRLPQFEAEYAAALDEARASYRLDRLDEVIEHWWLRTWATRERYYRHLLWQADEAPTPERAARLRQDAEQVRVGNGELHRGGRTAPWEADTLEEAERIRAGRRAYVEKIRAGLRAGKTPEQLGLVELTPERLRQRATG